MASRLLMAGGIGPWACVHPSLQVTDVTVGLARCCLMHTPKQNREGHIESETRKTIYTR